MPKKAGHATVIVAQIFVTTIGDLLKQHVLHRVYKSKRDLSMERNALTKAI